MDPIFLVLYFMMIVAIAILQHFTNKLIDVNHQFVIRRFEVSDDSIANLGGRLVRRHNDLQHQVDEMKKEIESLKQSIKY